MAIMRGRGAEADPVEQPAAGIDLAAHVEAILDDIEPRRFLLLARLGRVADGHAVEAVVMAVRDAEVAAVGDPRGARARGPRLGRRIRQRTLDRRGGSEIARILAVVYDLGRALCRISVWHSA